MHQCTIHVERLPDGSFKATCSLFPDAEAIADTEDGARRTLEAAIEPLLASRYTDELD